MSPKNPALEAMRRAPLSFFHLGGIRTSRCPGCSSTASHISSYPFHSSPDFARLVLCWCEGCGTGWVPSIPFSLREYYEKQYGPENRKDRDMPPADYFAEDSPVRDSRYFRRASSQLARATRYLPQIGSMLDFGSGPGYALFLSGADVKHAVEHDQQSTKYLKYIGARRVRISDLRNTMYDLILSSHSLEHLTTEAIPETLQAFQRAMKPDGLLYIEVPGGALSYYLAPAVKHEPHTIFFSPAGLRGALEREGFEVLSLETLAVQEQPIRDDAIYNPAEGGVNASTRGRITAIARRGRPKKGPLSRRARKLIRNPRAFFSDALRTRRAR